MSDHRSISVFEIIKVGVGPSSSHTMGPWRAALFFIEELARKDLWQSLQRIEVILYGSLSKTGKGHGSDQAIIAGLHYKHFRIISRSEWIALLEANKSSHEIALPNGEHYKFNPDEDIIYSKETLPFHPNGMTFRAHTATGVYEHTYYSIGGGFVVSSASEEVGKNMVKTPFQCNSGDDALRYCKQLNVSFAQLIRANEHAWHNDKSINNQALELWRVMKETIYRGLLSSEEILPGGLNVKRRAPLMLSKLMDFSPQSANELFDYLKGQTFDFTQINTWVSTFALAVNEENAGYGQIVTSPTNGASGVLPSVMAYAYCFLPNVSECDMIECILVAGEIGTYFKKGATISAALGGCQAEIGVSSAMAAGALTSILGGSPYQILAAAEMAMEHHLGLTCDPIGGLVQIPCIERNAMGASKAITASNLALNAEDNTSKVSFDDVVRTMMEIAQNMSAKYKETSEGGLAISVATPEC